MKNYVAKLFISLSNLFSTKQKEKQVIPENLDIPERVKYKYCDPKTYEKAKKIVEDEILNPPKYLLCTDALVIGPVLWTRYCKIEKLTNIEGGNAIFRFDDRELTGKMAQDIEDSKKIWDQLYEEIKGESFILRKANYDELDYYWTVIPFDIEEPLIILETARRNYILNIIPTTMKLMWIDEVP